MEKYNSCSENISDEITFIVQKFEGPIKQKVSSYYGIDIKDLVLDIEEAFIDDTKERKALFFVYDADENCYGVACPLDANGDITDYRCGKVG
ncbi:hypothetical protein COB57_05585 [Candidatus Peregrinibacteria bacterium]|nr:MAG: hypothetical protein COB57_05585 [Candidatus Peregrinibacteria bacterium]